ncbi:MAG: glycosyltransferase, partial [Methyloprofundus sp.]|nr:glycosyltransferase [Methyloprofundus sp.]
MLSFCSKNIMSDNKYEFTLNTAEKNDSHMGLATRIKPQQRVLELGCSSGYLTKFLQQELACQVVGVDIDSNSLARAAAYCEQTIIADLDSSDWLADIQGQIFDVVLCADVLEHLKNPVSLLQSLKPFLHAESQLLASVPNVAHASIRLELMQGHFDYESLGLLDDTHLHFYTRNGLIAMLMEAGYECCDISYSIHDIADEVIDQCLAKVGLQATATTRELLHAEEAIAFQYIVDARLAAEGLVQQVPEPLTPKPLLSSGVAYQEKQEAIDHLEQQLTLEREKNLSLSPLALEGEEAIAQTLSIVDASLFSLAEQLQQEREKNQALSDRLKQTADKLSQTSHKAEHLEQVLQRVHSKVSYKVIRGIKNIVQSFSGDTEEAIAEPVAHVDFFDYQSWRTDYGLLSEQSVKDLAEEQAQWHQKPKIALLMPVDQPDKQGLQSALDSIFQQLYTHFELCIAYDKTTGNDILELLQSYQQQEPRIKLSCSEQVGNQLNHSLGLAESDYITVMGQNDCLAVDALFCLAKVLNHSDDVQLIYVDEDQIDRQGHYSKPYFKPDWNPELFLSHDYISHLAVYKTQQVKALGGYDSAFEAAQMYDMALRYSAELKAKYIVHIPRVLYHYCAELNDELENRELYRKAVEQALIKQQRAAEVSLHPQLVNTLRVRYQLPENSPLVSIIIPTRNGYHLLSRCVSSIFAKTTYQNYELIIIDNGSDEVLSLRYLSHLQQDPRVTILRDDSPFNYSALNNKAVAQAKGEVIALLNNDLEVISE